MPAIRRPVTGGQAADRPRANEHNLRDIDVSFPGRAHRGDRVSGSGKSTLVNDIPRERLGQQTQRCATSARAAQARQGTGAAGQAGAGRPVADWAYAAVEPGDLHRCLRQDPHAVRGDHRGEGPWLPAGRFSFNVKGGRCEACTGEGTIKIEMNFLPDVYVPCEVCHGARYNRETLEVHYKGKTIAEVLDMPIEEAPSSSAGPAIHRYLKTLVDVGLGYVRLRGSRLRPSRRRGAAGEAGRRLQKRSTGRTIYILDEPTTGLHFEDIRDCSTSSGPRRQGQHRHRDRAQPRRHQVRRLDHRHGSRGRRRQDGRRDRYARRSGGGAAETTPAGSSRKSWNRIGSPTPGSVGRVSTTPPNDDGIPTFDEVRGKIERRAATAIGSGGWPKMSPEVRTVKTVRRSPTRPRAGSSTGSASRWAVTSDLDELVTRLRAAGCVFAEGGGADPASTRRRRRGVGALG